MNRVIKILYDEKNNWLLYLFFLSIFLSLDTSFNDISKLDLQNNKSIFINLRLVLPYCIFIIFIYVFKNYIKSDYKLSFFQTIIYCLIIGQFLQICSTIFSDNDILNLSFILVYLMLILVLIVAFNKNILSQIYLLALTIIAVITLIYGYFLIEWFFFDSFHKNLYGSWPMGGGSAKTLSNEVPRSSGIARSSLILTIPLSLFLIVQKKFRVLHYSFYLILVFLILATQSRLVIFSFIVGYIIILFYIFQLFLDIKKRVLNFILLILFPIILTFSVIELKHYMQINTELIISNENKMDLSDYSVKDDYKKLRKFDPESFSSQRFTDWKNILDSNKKIYFGYGALGDRHLINQSASSIFFYSFASGGLASLFIIVLVIFRSIYTNSLIIFKFENRLNKKNYLILSASLIQIFLIFRSFFESSFGVFGIDSIFFFTTFFLTEKYVYKRLKKILFRNKIFN